MATGSVTIEIDQTRAAILQAKAVQQGVSVKTLLQYLAGNITAATEEGLSPSSLEQFMAVETEYIPPTPITYIREGVYFDHD